MEYYITRDEEGVRGKEQKEIKMTFLGWEWCWGEV
jgi:hypothetical protein